MFPARAPPSPLGLDCSTPLGTCPAAAIPPSFSGGDTGNRPASPGRESRVGLEGAPPPCGTACLSPPPARTGRTPAGLCWAPPPGPPLDWTSRGACRTRSPPRPLWGGASRPPTATCWPSGSGGGAGNQAGRGGGAQVAGTGLSALGAWPTPGGQARRPGPRDPGGRLAEV